MARIRSIKPEFFTSEQVAECSPNARLLFVGMWCFCDDQGIHPASAARLKMEVFPGDAFTREQVSGMVAELIASGLLTEYVVSGCKYWLVTGWKHQKIDKPSAKYPLPLSEDSPNSRRTIPEPSGTDVDVDVDVDVEEEKAIVHSKLGTSSCPHAEIVAAYHEILPELPAVRTWPEDRAALLRTRWREDEVRQTLEWWREFFEYVRRCPFLLGQQAAGDRDPFLADLEWLIRPKNFRKVIEGKYESRRVAA